jgi:bifunctional non-homologous end joining protein LigD
MLSRPGPLPTGAGWAFEPKWDGFRAIVSAAGGLSVRSRRGWQIAQRVPELEALPGGCLFDGELVAFKGEDPLVPYVGDRILHDRDIPIVYIAFDPLDVPRPPSKTVGRRFESLGDAARRRCSRRPSGPR